jgi:endo-1,4-beta-D-glucanase Y
MLVLTLAVGCTKSAPAQAPGTGGAASGGGVTGTGGMATTGRATRTGGATGSGGVAITGGASNSGGTANAGGITGSGGSLTGDAPSTGGLSASGGATGGVTGAGGTTQRGGATGSGGILATGSTNGSGGVTNASGANGKGGTPSTSGAAFPFPQNFKGKYCTYPVAYDNAKVTASYQAWKDATIVSDGAGGFQRVKKPDSGTVIGSTVSEGIGYGMILAVYLDDQKLFDNLWNYEQLHLDSNGLMNWEIAPDGTVTSGGAGAASDGDEDMAWALVMADQQWGGKGALSDTYLNHAKKLIGLIWTFEVDQTRGAMLKPGDQWGNVDVTNPSYFAPAYYRVFGQVTGKTDDWNKVVSANYDILEKSLNATSGNASNGLVPAWCDSSGKIISPFSGAPTYFQNDSTRTPFRVGQDACYFGEPRAKSYLAKISSFYVGVGVSKIVDGYQLDGTPKPDKAVNGLQAASFVGPAGVGAMCDASYQSFVNDAYAAVATLNLTAGTIYYQKSWTALSLLMLTANLVDFTQMTK